MNPSEYEELVREHFRKQGFKTTLTPASNDYGVDVLAEKGKEKIAVQAKMYGQGIRKINRQMVMELHGAKDYFECTKAVLATDGEIMDDALTVAEKLKIEILKIETLRPPAPKFISKPLESGKITFESIWSDYIIPLEGKTLKRDNGQTNKIVKVDWSGVQRISSQGNKGIIKIEIFRLAINKLLTNGAITREYINQNYAGRASSGVVLILSQVPIFKLTNSPTGLSYIKYSICILPIQVNN